MIRSLLLLVLVLSTAASPGATDSEAPPWYDVEVLVFKHKTPAAGGELWPVDPGTLDLERATELVPIPQTSPLPGDAQPFQQLGGAALTLGTAAGKLAASRDYSPLLHLAWRQPVTAQADAPAVHLATEAAPGVAPTLDGTLRVSRSRFLHIDVDLLLRNPETDTTAGLVRLQQTRRVNSGEVHYFDHPLFGLLVKLTPYDPAGQKDGRVRPR